MENHGFPRKMIYKWWVVHILKELMMIQKKLFFAQRNETMEHTCRMKSNFNAGDSSIDGRLLI